MSEPGAWCTCGAGEYQPPEVHVYPCPGSARALAGEQDVDPANGTEPYVEPPAPELDEGRGPVFTAPEKIASVAEAVLSRPSNDAKVSALLAWLQSPLGRRFMLKPALALLPPMDEPDEWDAWLAMLVGCALELTSDGVDLDIPECRHNARQLLAALFDEAA